MSSYEISGTNKKAESIMKKTEKELGPVDVSAWETELSRAQGGVKAKKKAFNPDKLFERSGTVNPGKVPKL
jgi:hypothetical protein